MGTGRSGFGGGGGADSRNWETERAEGKVDGYSMMAPGDPAGGKAKLMGDYDGGVADKWYKGLTDDEKEGVDYYTQTGYEAINDILRGTGEPTGRQKEKAEKAIPNLEKALNDYELPQKTILHRIAGGSLLNGAKTLADVKALVGTEVTDPGFMSATAQLSRGLERSLTTGVDEGRIRYHIKTPAGKGIGAYLGKQTGHTMSEGEFLFNDRSKFRVLGGYTKVRDAGKPWATEELHVNLLYTGRSK